MISPMNAVGVLVTMELAGPKGLLISVANPPLYRLERKV